MSATTGVRVILDRYALLRRIGSGGMGQVFEALDRDRGRKVAIKCVDVTKLSTKNHMRIRREADALERFSHPNIVGFFGLEADGERYYCIMEFIEGESLATRIERDYRLDGTSIARKDLERCARDIASALHHAHMQDVVHRDVKPDNVIIAADGRFVLTDFGLAKVKDLFALTTVGQSLGTVWYFAPEQMRGESAVEKSDMYQYGLTLFEAATGTLPFASDPPLIALKRRITEPIPAPSGINEQCPEGLARLILQCLQPRMEDRPESFEQIVSYLDATPL